VLLILGVFLPMFFVAIWQLNRLNPTKKSVKAGDQGVKEMYGVFTSQVNDVLKIKDKQISSLSAKLRIYEQEVIEEELVPNEKRAKSVTFEEITQLVQSTYPKYAALLPLFKKQIIDATKGMTLNEIIQYITTLTGQTGKGPLAKGSAASYEQNKTIDWA